MVSIRPVEVEGVGIEKLGEFGPGPGVDQAFPPLTRSELAKAIRRLVPGQADIADRGQVRRERQGEHEPAGQPPFSSPPFERSCGVLEPQPLSAEADFRRSRSGPLPGAHYRVPLSSVRTQHQNDHPTQETGAVHSQRASIPPQVSRYRRVSRSRQSFYAMACRRCRSGVSTLPVQPFPKALREALFPKKHFAKARFSITLSLRAGHTNCPNSSVNPEFAA